MARFVGQDPPFGGWAAWTFTASRPFDGGPGGGCFSVTLGLDFVEQLGSGKLAIQPLLARLLTLNADPRWAMSQHDAGGSLVYVLATVPSRPNESLFQVRFADTQGGHPFTDLIICHGNARFG
jgi:hypothetical protein